MGKISLIYGKVPISSQTTLLNFNYNLLNTIKSLTQFCFVPYPGVKICTILPVFQYHMTSLKAMLHTQGNFSPNSHFEVLQVKCFFNWQQCLLHWKSQNKNCQVTWPWGLTPRVASDTMHRSKNYIQYKSVPILGVHQRIKYYCCPWMESWSIVWSLAIKLPLNTNCTMYTLLVSTHFLYTCTPE